MNPPLTPAERGDLAEAMVPLATRLAFLVREASPEAVHRFLHDINPAHHHALMVVLAAMIDIDRSPRELLAWVTWHWDGWAEAA